MFKKDMLGPTKTPVLPGTGPQLPNAADRHRVLYIWDVYHPDWVKLEDAYKYLVPRENEVVLDPENDRVYRCTHVNMESDLKPTLTPIFGTGEDKGGLESIFGLPGGFQGEAVLGIDYSVRPNRAVIDGQVMCPGAAYALLYRGNVVGAEGEVISVLYSSNSQMISNRIPVKLAALHELTNSEIMVTEPFSVNKNEAELPDGSRVTLVWFDHAGNPIPKARTLSVMHTAIMRDHHVGKKYITKVSLIAPWFTNSNDADTLYVPMNTGLQSLAFRAQVHYSDGSRSEELPIDGSKIKLFGVNEHKPSTSGQRGTLTLVYDLDKDESMYEAQPGSPNQFRKSYWVLATDFDGAYSPRIYSYPDWQGNQYQLRHFLTDLNRGFSVDVTEHVRLNELSAPFRPTTYGVEQTLELNLRLSDAVPSFKPLIMRQSITYVLKGPGGDAGSKFSVRYSYDRPSYNDVTLRAANMVDGKQEITFGVAFNNQKEWLDTLYSGVEPGYSVTMESGPLTPTHFQIIASSSKVYEFSLSDWNKRLYLDQQEPQGRMVVIRWIHQTQQGEKLILAISGLTVDVKQGGGALPPKATVIQADSTLPTSVMEGSVITVSGMVYDQYGNPYLVGDQKVWVDGGIQGKQEVNINALGEFSLLTVPKGVAGTKETFNFSFTETGEVLSKYEPDIAVDNQNVVAKVYPYSPRDVHLGKPGRVYGYLTRDGQPLANYIFYSSIDGDPTSLKQETTDKNGDFIIEVVKPDEAMTAKVWIHAKDKISHQLTWKDQVAFGEVVTSDKELLTFVDTKGGELTGKVYDQFGNPASYVSVTLTKGPEWTYISGGSTNALGEFKIKPNVNYFELEEETEVVMYTSGGFVKTKLKMLEGLKMSSVVFDSDIPTEAIIGSGVLIKGTCYDQYGEPFYEEGAKVYISGFTYHPYQVPVTPGGRFEIMTTYTSAVYRGNISARPIPDVWGTTPRIGYTHINWVSGDKFTSAIFDPWNQQIFAPGETAVVTGTLVHSVTGEILPDTEFWGSLEMYEPTVKKFRSDAEGRFVMTWEEPEVSFPDPTVYPGSSGILKVKVLNDQTYISRDPTTESATNNLRWRESYENIAVDQDTLTFSAGDPLFISGTFMKSNGSPNTYALNVHDTGTGKSLGKTTKPVGGHWTFTGNTGVAGETQEIVVWTSFSRTGKVTVNWV